MGRKILFIAAFLVLVLALPLCSSGVLLHACETCAEAACSHESNCAQDPCSPHVIQNETTNTLSSLVHCNAHPLLHTWLTPATLAFSFHEQARREATFLPRTKQPYPIGAFPLLV